MHLFVKLKRLVKWLDQVVFEYALVNEWEEIMQESGFRNGSANSLIFLYMKDAMGIEPILENYRFVQNIMRE